MKIKQKTPNFFLLPFTVWQITLASKFLKKERKKNRKAFKLLNDKSMIFDVVLSKKVWTRQTRMQSKLAVQNTKKGYSNWRQWVLWGRGERQRERKGTKRERERERETFYEAEDFSRCFEMRSSKTLPDTCDGESKHERQTESERVCGRWKAGHEETEQSRVGCSTSAAGGCSCLIITVWFSRVKRTAPSTYWTTSVQSTTDLTIEHTPSTTN